MDIKTTTQPEYMLTPEEQERRTEVYSRIQKMFELKDQPMPHWSGGIYGGMRSFNEYIDDSERVLNGYTMTREDQNKEPWQSNMLDNITLAKMRATATGVGLKVPDMRFTAVHKKGFPSWVHADLLKGITRETFNADNPTLHSFLEIWQMLSHGGLVEYEGYKTGGVKQKMVKSFDSRTGDVETETKYVEFDAAPHSVIVNPQEFLWWTFFVRDIQDQPHLAWVQKYNGFELEQEFSKYPKYKYVKDKKDAAEFRNLVDTTYLDYWSERVGETDEYEVVRFYSKADDAYEIWINGIPLLRAPLLWTSNGKKYYPFAKSISNPMANPNFFWGMSFPAILESYQDTKNTVVNTMADILYQSADPRTLVGLQNKDVLEWESNFIQRDNRYYVPDVNQVRLEPTRALNSGDFAFLKLLDAGIESMSIDNTQQGQTGGQKTAREVVIANQRAQEIRGMLYLFLEDLWLQKTRLRVKNVLNHLLKDKAAAKSVREQIISIQDYVMPTGEQGQLDIHVANSPASQLSPIDIQGREAAMGHMGEVYKIVSILKNAFDDFKVDCYIIPESLHQADRMQEETDLKGELQMMITLDPGFVSANLDRYRRRALALYGRSLEDYTIPPPQQAPQPGQPQNGTQVPTGAPGQQQPPQPSPTTDNVLGL